MATSRADHWLEALWTSGGAVARRAYWTSAPATFPTATSFWQGRCRLPPPPGWVRPWTIVSVHLFDASELAGDLRKRGVKVGVASSVRQVLWQEAEIYPQQRNCRLLLTPGQREMLALFAQPHGRTP